MTLGDDLVPGIEYDDKRDVAIEFRFFDGQPDGSLTVAYRSMLDDEDLDVTTEVLHALVAWDCTATLFRATNRMGSRHWAIAETRR